MANEVMIAIPGRLHSVATEGITSGANEIYDDGRGAFQSDLNGGILEEKAYSSGSDNGMGRVVLKKNIVSNVNTLTQAMINTANTIYVIQYDFVLGENITVPANCVLEFDGGSISAGSGENMDTITGNNTSINAGLVKIFNTDITLAGNWNVAEAYLEWFDAKGDGVTDDSVALRKVNSIRTSSTPSIVKLGNLILSNKSYVLKQDVELYYNLIGCAGTKIIFDGGSFNNAYSKAKDESITISNVRFTATNNSNTLFSTSPNFYIFDRCVFENCISVFNSGISNEPWLGGLVFNNCIFRNISNYIIKTAHYINAVSFNSCFIYNTYCVMYATIYDAVVFNCCDIENSCILRRSGNYRGVSFIGCYIEYTYTQEANDGLIKLSESSQVCGCIKFDSCFVHTNGNYVIYEPDTATIEYSNINRGIIKFLDCVIYREDNSFSLFYLQNTDFVNDRAFFIVLEGVKQLIGKWNSIYSLVTQFKNLSDICNVPERIISNLFTYEYGARRMSYNPTTYKGNSTWRPLGIGNSENKGFLDPSTDIGFMYFDTSIGKPIYAKEIANDGTVTWVDATGTPV